MPAVPRATALAALERSFDGGIPDRLRAAAEAGGAAAADRRAALAEARLYQRQASEARQALAARRRHVRPADPTGDPDLARAEAALTRSRALAVARLSAAGRSTPP